MTEAHLAATKSGLCSAAVFNVSVSYSANSELLPFRTPTTPTTTPTTATTTTSNSSARQTHW